jgi:ketosteroid isomerase-like protein
MSIEQNKQTVRSFFERMDGGDIDGAFELVADDAKWWIPNDQPGGMTLAKSEIQGTVGFFFGAFKKAPEMIEGAIVAEGDALSMLRTGRGGKTHGGHEYNNDYHMFFRFRDGKIIEVREYMNPLLAVELASEIQAAIAAA